MCRASSRGTVGATRLVPVAYELADRCEQTGGSAVFEHSFVSSLRRLVFNDTADVSSDTVDVSLDSGVRQGCM